MTGKRKIHDFCWTNVMTPELSRAAEFFAQVLGWTYAEGIPGGHVIHVNGLAAGALIDLAQCPPGLPPSIGVMIKVENADSTVVRVNQLGGSAEPAIDIRGNGRMATCIDPTGAAFAVWQPLAKDGAECDTHAPGAPTWFETLTTDPQRAVEFYVALFGWTPVTSQPAPGMTYTVFEHEGAQIAGAMAILSDKMPNVPSHWATYFTVKDTDETVRLAKALGAELCVVPHDVPNVGRFALMKSPQAVPFHVLQYFTK